MIDVGSRRAFVLAVVAILDARAPGQDRAPGPKPPIASSSRAPSISQRVCQALSEVSSEARLSVTEQSARLADLGPEVIPVLLNLLQAETVTFGRKERSPSPAGSIDVLDGRQEEVAILALSRLRRSELVQPLGRSLLCATGPRARAAFLRVFGAIGEGPDIPRLCDAVAPADPNGDFDFQVAPAFEGAVAEILKRDLKASGIVQDLLRKVLPSTRMVLLRSLGDSATSSALRVLGRRLGVEPAEDPFVLKEIAHAALTTPLPVEPVIQSSVRPYLLSEDPCLLQSAISVLGRLEDVDSVPRLIELLAHENPSIREAAQVALCEVTGVNLLADEKRWRAWYDGETTWFTDVASGWIDDLRRGGIHQRSTTIARLSEHPLFRNEIAEILLNVLPRERDSIRIVGCSALGQLGAASAIPYLRICANDPEPHVAAAAAAALDRIQKKRLHAFAPEDTEKRR